ncbi:MAG: hypothetical protein IT247_04225 [Bacteroidia bacterium]|nr:hypothetical protein [Bacteroidia bacterium]
MKSTLLILVLTIWFLFVSNKSEAAMYHGYPYIAWDQYHQTGTLYCYGTLMANCCSITGGVAYIYGYDIYVNVYLSSPEITEGEDVVSSEHEIEAQD